MVVFVTSGGSEVSFGPAVASGLAALGVSRITLLRDAGGAAVVLEGWAFDEASVPDARAVLGVDATARAMTTVAEASIAREPAHGAAAPASLRPKGG